MPLFLVNEIHERVRERIAQAKPRHAQTRGEIDHATLSYHPGLFGSMAITGRTMDSLDEARAEMIDDWVDGKVDATPETFQLRHFMSRWSHHKNKNSDLAAKFGPFFDEHENELID
jgi:hypothetical protein